MPESIPSWKTSDDKIHQNYLAALKHELMLWLAKAGDNEVGAKKIVESITADSIGEIVTQLLAIQAELNQPKSFMVKEKDDHLIQEAD